MQNPGTVLIIDDEPAMREALEALLTAGGYQLGFAPDGPRGLARAAELYPDLILLDVMMPGMDGFEVCRRLRADPLLGEVPIVMITALDDTASRLRGIEAGADDFISKPFDKAELRARVRTICRLNRYRHLLTERIRFQWIIEQSQEGYLVLTAEGGMRYANPQAQLYLSLPEAPGGQSFLEVARRQYRCEPEAAWQLWAAGTPPSTPYYLVRPETPTARTFWLQVDELDLPQAAGLKRVVRLRDVTEALSGQRDMRRFQNALTHKLRTPISAMHMSLYLLKQSAGQTPVPAAEILGLATESFHSVERLNQELHDIFQYIAAPVLAQAGQQVSLGQLPTVVALLADNLHLPNVSVTAPEALQAQRLTLSAAALDSILRELLENAKKFHPQQSPQIEVVMRVSPHAPETVQLLVRDDGISLSPEQIEWALTPYVQSEKYFTGEVRGMGLGLALVSTLVWQVGGSIRLANRLDRPGVVVELSLPLAKGSK